MPLINWEVNLILTWSANCVISSHTAATQAKTFTITDTKLYVPVVTLSINDNAKPIQQLKSGFKRTINWNKYQLKAAIQARNQYLNYLIGPSFQRVNRPLVLSFENNEFRTVHTRYFLPTIEIEKYKVIINVRNFFDQPVQNDIFKETIT